MALQYVKVINCISKPPDQRLTDEVNDLIPWFYKKSEKIFKSLTPDLVADIIRNCQLNIVKKDTVIVRQGEQGDSFYIVLRGQVSVLIAPTADQPLKNDISEVDIRMAPLVYDEQCRLNREPLGRTVTKLEDGNTFGELALLSVDCVRSATVVADTNTVDLAIISRQVYARSLRAWQAAEFDARVAFVDNHRLFASWPMKYRRQLAMSLCRETGLQFEKTVVKQGRPADVMYFIIKGQCKILVDPSLHPVQIPQVLYQYSTIDSKVHLAESGSNHARNLDLEKRSYIKGEIQEDYRVQKKTRRPLLEVCLVGENDAIGDVEFALNLPVYIHTVVCTQSTDLYSVSLANYERLVKHCRHNKRAVEQMRDLIRLKLDARISRLGNNVVPVLCALCTRLEAVENISSAKNTSASSGGDEKRQTSNHTTISYNKNKWPSRNKTASVPHKTDGTMVMSDIKRQVRTQTSVSALAQWSSILRQPMESQSSTLKPTRCSNHSDELDGAGQTKPEIEYKAIKVLPGSRALIRAKVSATRKPEGEATFADELQQLRDEQEEKIRTDFEIIKLGLSGKI